MSSSSLSPPSPSLNLCNRINTLFTSLQLHLPPFCSLNIPGLGSPQICLPLPYSSLGSNVSLSVRSSLTTGFKISHHHHYLQLSFKPALFFSIAFSSSDLLRCCSGQRASSCDDEGSTWIFSSCGGILELRRGFQASSCVGPGSLIFHSS